MDTVDQFEFTEHSHQRFNPLSNSWILCSPHRAKRPWLGQQETPAALDSSDHIPGCFLCPRNTRMNKEVNPNYKSTFIFTNDFPAVREVQPEYHNEILLSTGILNLMRAKDEGERQLMKNLFMVQSVRGTARVICFSPKHNVTMAQMQPHEITLIIHAWRAQLVELKALESVNYVTIFENKGEAMGCSNPHPHGQIWATETIPQEPAKELASLAAYRVKNGCCMLCDLVKLEISTKDRMIEENDSFICIVPFWALWPFETLILSKNHLSSLVQFNAKEDADLADIMQSLTARYDNMFECSFPYSMGIHQSPVKEDPANHEMHFHIHFYPPLLRSATVKKFLTGFEMMGEPQRDLTAEQAVARIRSQSRVHYGSN